MMRFSFFTTFYALTIVLSSLNLTLARPAQRRLPIPQTPDLIELTNAKRMQLGIPLKSPFQKRHASSTKNEPPCPEASTGPVKYIKGVIKVYTNRTTDQSLGWISKNQCKTGTYQLDRDGKSKLSVKFPTNKGWPTHIMTLNGPNVEYPYFGAVMDPSATCSDLERGTSNFAVFVGTDYSSPNSPAVKGRTTLNPSSSRHLSQASIWKFDAATQELTAKWVNKDNKAAEAGFCYREVDNTFVFSADRDRFRQKVGPCTDVTFVFVEDKS